MTSVTEMPSLKIPGREASLAEWQAIVDRLRSQQMLRAIEHGDGPQCYELEDGRRVPIMAGGSVTATWTDPTSATLDLLTGQTATQAWTEAIASNLDYLLGTDGASPTAGLMVRMGDTKLGGATTNITFSSIPATFKHLLADYFGRGDGAVTNDTIMIQCNGDSTSGHYAYQYSNALNTVLAGASSTTATSIQGPYLAGASSTAGVSGGGRIEFPNYADTSGSMGRPCVTQGGNAKNLAMLCSIGYFDSGSQAAITSIKFFPGTSTNLVTGSRITLYGLN